MATTGLGTSAYIAHKGDDKLLWIPLGYFSLMELLQAVSYPYIDSCDLYINHLLTVLGYIHIAFQPFFINAVSLYFLPEGIRRKIAPWAYGICFAATVGMLVKLYPFHAVTGSMGACVPGLEAMCGTALCTVTGSWHLAWNIPFSVQPGFLLTYTLPAFILPMLYGSWRITLYQIILGPLLAQVLTSNLNEWPAVWCLLSVGYILIGFLTPLRAHLFVQKWYFWKYPFEEGQK